MRRPCLCLEVTNRLMWTIGRILIFQMLSLILLTQRRSPSAELQLVLFFFSFSFFVLLFLFCFCFVFRFSFFVCFVCFVLFCLFLLLLFLFLLLFECNLLCFPPPQGLHVLGEFVYTGETGGVYSDEALADPYNRYMTFAFDFISLPFMKDVITDSHFREVCFFSFSFSLFFFSFSFSFLLFFFLFEGVK